jgi:hypothetical protein
MVFEGNTSLGTPDRVANSSAYEAQRIGEFDVMVTETDRAWVFFRPRPEVQVEGALSLLEPLLTGPRNPGGPCPDVLSLQSTRERRLIEVGLDLGERAMRDEVLGKLFADTEWPDGGAPRVLYGRVHDHGDADDPHVMIEVVLRHVDDGDGMAVTEKALDALIASAKANPKAVAARPMLAAIERSRDRGDLILKLDLGRARDAVGKLAMTLMPLLIPAEIEARAAPAAPAAPEPKKK